MGIGIGLRSGMLSGDGVFTNTLSTTFDQVNERVDVGTVSSFNFIHNDAVFTISFFIKFTDHNEDNAQLIMGNNGFTDVGFRIGWENRAGQGTRQLVTTIRSTDGQLISSNSSTNIITDNDWHPVVVTANGTNVFYTVDGVKETGSSSVTQRADADSTNPLGLGRSNAAASFLFGGNLDEVALWNVELSDSDVAILSEPTNLLSHPATSNLVTWLRMGDGDTFPTIIDNKGNNDGTMINMAANNFVEDVI